MRDIPPQALTAVDGAFVLDFYLADRPILEATIHRLSYDFRTRPFEYVVFARDGLRRFLPLMSDVVLVRAYGDRSDPFAPYAELFRRTHRESVRLQWNAGAHGAIGRYNPSLRVAATSKPREDTPP
jgi:hypothetical protein